MKKQKSDSFNSLNKPCTIYSGSFILIVSFSFLATLMSGCQTEKDKVPIQKKSTTDRVDLDHLVMPTKRTKIKEALKLYVKSKRDRTDPEALIEASVYAMEHDDFSAAEVLANRALKYKESALAYSLRGRAKFNSFDKRDDSALEDLIKAVELGSTDSDDYIAISSIYDNQKKPRKAIEYLTLGLKICEDKDIYVSRATIYTTLKDYENALKDYNKMLEKFPDYDRGHILRGQLHERFENYDLALDDYKKATAKNKDGEITTIGISARKLRVLLFNKLGKHEKAIEELTVAMTESQDDHDELLQLRGEQYTKIKEYDKAISDFNQSIKGSPRFARLSYLGRAKVYEHLGKKKLASDDRKKAEQLMRAPAEKAIY